MVAVDTKLSTLQKLIGKKISLKELEQALFDIGMELDSHEGDDLKIDVTAERHDMISPQGVARALKAYLGIKTGMPNFKVIDSKLQMKVEKTEKAWPYAVACIVKGLKLDDEKITEIIQLQEPIL